MIGFVVDVEATSVLAQFMTQAKNLSAALNETFRMYENKDIHRIKIIQEKGKK